MAIDVCQLYTLSQNEVGGWRHLSPSSTALLGYALYALGLEYLWHCDGDDDLSPASLQWMRDSVSQLAAEMSKSMIGVIVALATDVLPANMLWCNGAAYQRADYPELVAVLHESLLPENYPDIFWTPPLQCRTIVGAGVALGLTARELGEQGGEEAHMMTWHEMVAHNHQYVEPVPTAALEGAGVPLPTGLTVAVGYTGVTPFDYVQQPMNVMQPFWVGNYAIIAR